MTKVYTYIQQKGVGNRDKSYIDEQDSKLSNRIYDLESYFKQPNPNDLDLLPEVGGEIPPPAKRKEIELSTDSIAFLEGTNMTPQVRLSVEPIDSVTISIINSNPEIQVNPSTLTFTPSNYNKYQALDVRGGRVSSEGDLTSTITLSAQGGGYDSVETKLLSVTMIAAGGELPPPVGEFMPIANGDIKCINGSVDVSGGKIHLNSFTGGYAMIHTEKGINGFEGMIETEESHIVLATNIEGTSVVSVYFKNTSGMIFKTVDGSANSSGNLANVHNQALSVGDTLKIIPTKGEVGKIDIYYKDAIQNQISLSELEEKSGLNNLRFAFGIISNTSTTLFSNVKVMGKSGGEIDPPIDPPVEGGDVEIPIANVIDSSFTTSTQSFGNTVEYTLSANNTLRFDIPGSNRFTVFTKPLKSLKFKVLDNLDWMTIFSNADGNVGNGLYTNNPSQFGYVTFTGFDSGGYVFASEHPTLPSMNKDDIVELRYSVGKCDVYINSIHSGEVLVSKYTDTSGNIPRVGFKTDGNRSSGYEPVQILNATFEIGMRNIHSDYGYGITQKLERSIDHIKYLHSQINNGGVSTINNPFKGKMASAIGDSITSDGSYLNPLKTKLELSSVQNLAIGGQGYTGGAFLGQVPNISSNSKLIIMAGGVNDFRVNKPLGTPQDMGNVDTFYGALYKTFRDVAERHSDKKVVIATFHNNKEHVHTMYPAWDKPNSLGNYAWEYIEAMRQRATMFGFPVADVYGESGINVQDHCTTDGIHLNAEGGARMSEIIKDTVLTKPYYKF